MRDKRKHTRTWPTPTTIITSFLRVPFNLPLLLSFQGSPVNKNRTKRQAAATSANGLDHSSGEASGVSFTIALQAIRIISTCYPPAASNSRLFSLPMSHACSSSYDGKILRRMIIRIVRVAPTRHQEPYVAWITIATMIRMTNITTSNFIIDVSNASSSSSSSSYSSSSSSTGASPTVSSPTDIGNSFHAASFPLLSRNPGVDPRLCGRRPLPLLLDP